MADTVNNTLNLCFLIDELRTGGTETQLLKLIGQLDRSRVRPHLCLLDGTSDDSRQLEPDNCPIERLGVRKLLSFHSLLRSRKFIKTLQNWQIDVLQVVFPDSTYFGVPLAKWAGVPCVVRTRRDLFYWVTPVHRHLGRWLDGIYNRYLVDAMIVNSEAVRDSALKNERPAPKQITVIPNGLELSQFSNRLPRTNGDRLSIGIVSMLRPEKRLDLFVNAAREVAKEVSNTTFVIAGEGPERSRLETQIAEAGLQDQFKLPGKVENIASFLEQLDIAVLCSDTEGLSNALVEYMASGLPVVATAVGGNVELLKHEETGLLTPPGNASALSAALLELVRDSQKRLRLGTNAQQAVQNKFDLGRVATAYEDFYSSLLKVHTGNGLRPSTATSLAT